MATMTTSGGVDIAYEEFGDKEAPTVLFIRGTGAAGNRWMPQVETYQATYRCIIFDNRGAGASSAPPPPYTVADMATDTIELMDHLGVASAHLSGSSLGGAIALRIAATQPSRVRSLQLHSSWLATDRYAGYSLNLLRTLLVTGGVNFYYEATIPLLFSPGFLTGSYEKLQGILEGMQEHAATYEGLLGQIDANMSHDGRSAAATINTPTLVTVGELDLLLPASESLRLHQAISGSEYHVFPGGGHLVSMEAANDFNDVTMSWLKDK